MSRSSAGSRGSRSPRVSFDLSQAGAGLLTIDIGYVVRATNTERNLVHPFYVIPAEEME